MNSSFTSRFNTSHHVADEEIPKIRQIISESLEERARIQDKITRFHALIDDLHLQMRRIDDHIHGHRTLLPGIRKLPVELMQTIFFWCLPPRNSAMSSEEAPLLLGRVCSAWRKICFSTPLLWSSLHITPPVGRGAGNRDMLVRYGEAITAWLNRSATLPISVSFVDDVYTSLDANPELKTNSHLLEILLRFSHRWIHLNFRILHRWLRPLTRLTENDVPLLKTVQISIINTPLEGELPLLPFLRSPSIQKFFLWDYPFPAPSAFPVQWELLTTLCILSRGSYNRTALTMSGILNVWSRCSSLVVCAVEISTSDIVTASTRSLSLPILEELRIRLSGWQIVEEQVPSFFRILDLPQLRHLELTDGHKSRQIPFMPLLFQKNKVDTMAFDVEAGTVDQLLECLHMTPSLKRLYLNSSFIDRPYGLSQPGNNGILVPPLSANFLGQLTPKSSAPTTILCPLLKEVELRFHKNSDVTDDDILQFLLSRTTLAPDGVARLTRASFIFQRHKQRDIDNELAPAIQKGLVLSLEYASPTPASVPAFLQPFKAIDISAPIFDDDWVPRLSRGYYNPTWL